MTRTSTWRSSKMFWRRPSIIWRLGGLWCLRGRAGFAVHSAWTGLGRTGSFQTSWRMPRRTVPGGRGIIFLPQWKACCSGYFFRGGARSASTSSTAALQEGGHSQEGRWPSPSGVPMDCHGYQPCQEWQGWGNWRPDGSAAAGPFGGLQSCAGYNFLAWEWRQLSQSKVLGAMPGRKSARDCSRGRMCMPGWQMPRIFRSQGLLESICAGTLSSEAWKKSMLVS